MAEQFTILPSFVSQESNTAVLEDNGFADKLIESARIKYAVDEAKHQAAQERLARSIDFKSGDILQVDMEYINGQTDEYLKWISDNAKLLANQDPMTVSKQKQWKNKIDTQTDIAIGRKKQVDNQRTYLQTDAAINSGYGRQEDYDTVDNFAKTPMGEWTGYKQPDMYNELTYFGNYKVDTEKNVDDKGYTKTTTDTTPAANILARAEYMKNSPIEYNKLLNHYIKLSNAARNGTTQNFDVYYYDPEDFRKNGENATPKVIKLAELTPDNIGNIIPYKKYALDEAYKNLKDVDKQVPPSPKSDDKNGSNLPEGYSNQDVDKSFEVLKGTGGTSSKGEVYKTSYKVTYENGKKVSKEVGKEKIEDSTIVPLGGGSLTVTLKDNNGRDKEYAISNIIKVGDKLYFGVKGADGKYEMTPNYEIKDYFQDVIQPIYNRQYQATGNAAKALTEAQIYAWQTDPVSAAKLGYPKPLGINLNNSTNTTSTTTNTGGVNLNASQRKK